MPIYEYGCKSCGKHFERLQKVSDSPVCKCPGCGKRAKRLISQTSFALKGGGWYKDGYSTKKEPPKSEEGKKNEGEKKKTGDEKAKPKDKAAD